MNEVSLETPVSTTVETEVVTPELMPAAPPVELRYEYQPTDDQNRPIGGRQVIIYTTQEELVAEFQKRNVELLRKLRSETRKNRLGITEQETIGEDAPRFSENVLSFQPKPLSAEDRVRISRDLLDPERFDEASDELFTAKLGVSPTALTKTISELQADSITQKAVAEANAFAAANPDYLICQENAEAITNWLVRYKLAPVRANFQRAYETLKMAGILVERPAAFTPEPVAEIPPAAPILTETVVEEIPPAAAPVVEPPKPVSRVPVSLNRSNTDETGAPPASSGSDIVYEVTVNGLKRKFVGLAAVEAMPADEYRRRVMTDPNFVKKIEKLEQEKRARKQR